MDLKTPLYDTHVKYGGKIVPFAGYLLPVQYASGIAAEHMAVRTAAGLFDVSHMGEVKITGRDALKNINLLVTNDCSGMYDGQVRYSPMCNESGGVVDDLLIYRSGENDYMIVVNAANHDKDVKWMKSRISGDAELNDISNEIALLALQGPKSKEILLTLADESDIPSKYYSFKSDVNVGGIKSIVSKTGYTGEDGFELYIAPGDAVMLWEKLMDAGRDFGLVPCGLGARDTLRLEAALPLYGHEMDEVITPFEAGLGFFVKMAKDEFIGKAALVKKGEPTVHRIGIELSDRGITRNGDRVFKDGKDVGYVTSGTMCPYVKKAVGMVLVSKNVNIGDVVTIEIRGRQAAAKVVPLPFYKKSK